jgi:hypothetical protein
VKYIKPKINADNTITVTAISNFFNLFPPIYKVKGCDHNESGTLKDIHGCGKI